MRWLRPTVLRGDGSETVDEVARHLEAVALEAPPPAHAHEIRAAVLREVEETRPAVPALAPLGLLAGALLLALAIGIGAPAVGTFIGTLLDQSGPSELPPAPSITDDAALPEPPMPSDAPIPTRASEAAPSAQPADSIIAPRQPAATAAPVATQPAAAPPSPPPSTPTPRPRPPSEPPVPVPTPPATGPPPGTPGG